MRHMEQQRLIIRLLPITRCWPYPFLRGRHTALGADCLGEAPRPGRGRRQRGQQEASVHEASGRRQ